MPIHTLKMLPSLFKYFTTSSISDDDSDNSVRMSTSLNPTRFVEDALFCSDPFALSYSDPDQKWIIREHLVSLLLDFPSLEPSVAVFTHNDGTDVRLLYAAGDLLVSAHAPSVPLTVWVHELYPHVAPIVYINVADSPLPICENYPFADCASGAAASAYVANWHFAKSSLSGLVRSLTKLFRHNHPFHSGGGSDDRLAHPSFASRMEATDRLASSICHDAAAIMARTGEEIESLAAVQAKLKERSETAAVMVSELERERSCLKSRSDAVYSEADRLLNWLKVHAAANSSCAAVDDAFEAADDRSEAAMELLAADSAAEDVMYKLDGALLAGAVQFDVYLKQVRILAREQFILRAKMDKISKLGRFFR